MIIDAQLHEIGPRRHSSVPDDVRADLTTEVTLAWMDAVGVDAALLNPIDRAWGDSAVAQWPDRFALVLSVGSDPAATEALVDEACRRDDVVGLRLVIGRRPADPDGARGRQELRAGKFDLLLRLAEECRIPLFVFATGLLSDLSPVLERHSGLQVIVDHIGVSQAPMDEPEPSRWRALPELLALATHPNLAVKLCGAPALSLTGYPYSDVWPHLATIVEAFGPERLMWASDIGRFQARIGLDRQPETARGSYLGKHTYAESIGVIRDAPGLSVGDRELIFGGTVKRIVGWPREAP